MNPKLKKTTPIIKEIHATSLIKASISFLKGVSSPPAEDAKFAIYPITVESPVKITIPFPLPYPSIYINSIPPYKVC